MKVEIDIDESLLNKDILLWLCDSSNESKLVALRIGYRALVSNLITKDDNNEVVDIVSDIGRVLDDGISKIMSNNNNMDMLLTPIMNRFDHFSNSIEKLTNITAVSSLRGKLGEEIVSQNIARVFPDIELCDVSGHTAEGDYHFMSDPAILIEVKTYSRNVPTKEVDKIRRDMHLMGMSGILL
jgi:hypothetical protein